MDQNPYRSPAWVENRSDEGSRLGGLATAAALIIALPILGTTICAVVVWIVSAAVRAMTQ